MPSINVAQTVNKMKLGNADKVALTTLLNGLVDDIETLRAKNAALTAKLDADAGVTDANYTSLTAVTAGSLKVGK